MSAFLSVVAVAQDPIAQRPVGTVPVDSAPELTAADSARLDSLRERQRHTRCWRARPMPECRMVFLTDFGIEAPLRTTKSNDPNARHYSRAFDVRGSWSVGLMRNGDRHSHGVSLALTTEAGTRFPMIAEYRYRQWRRHFAIDAGVGLKQNDVWIDNVGLVRGRGFTTLLGASPNRWVGANLRYEQMTVRGKRFTGVMLGLQSTRVSEYVFQGLALAIVDGLLGKIGLERETGEQDSPETL